MIASKVCFLRDRVKPAARAIAAKAMVIAGWATIVVSFALVVWMGYCIWQTFAGED
jgi:hypothetical protein